MPVRLGLIGLGAIGTLVVELARRSPAVIELVGAVVADPLRARAADAPPCVADAAALLARRPDCVIECGGQQALARHGAAVLEAGVDLVPASVGLLADDVERARLERAAQRGRGRLRLSAGAIVGIDGLIAARHVGLDQVVFRSVMSEAAWATHAASAHVSQRASEPAGGDAATTGVPLAPSQRLVFRGSAREAARRYPKHANLAATIALAGLGFERTQVELVADARATRNRHAIHASGAFGRFELEVQGERIAAHSASSRLVAGSLLATALDQSVPFPSLESSSSSARSS